MNYHNFASRLTTQRLPASGAKEIAKPAPKKARRPGRRRDTAVEAV